MHSAVSAVNCEAEEEKSGCFTRPSLPWRDATCCRVRITHNNGNEFMVLQSGKKRMFGCVSGPATQYWPAILSYCCYKVDIPGMIYTNIYFRLLWQSENM